MKKREKTREPDPSVGSKQNDADAGLAARGFLPSRPISPLLRTAFAGASVALCLLAIAWGLLVFRASQHYRSGLEAERAGKSAEAARELQSAVGCCTPFNPYCGAAAQRLLELSRNLEGKDPVLQAEVRDRLVRSLRGARWLFQPHGELLAEGQSHQPAPPPKDPNGWLFLLSCAALVTGLGSWWLRGSVRFRTAVSATGLALWAVLIYLC